MVKDNINIQMEINTKESSRMILNMEKVYIIIQMAVTMKDYLQKEKKMVEVNFNYKMVPIMWVIFLMINFQVMEYTNLKIGRNMMVIGIRI